MNSLLLRWSPSLALLPFMIAFLTTSRAVSDPPPPAPAPTEAPNHHIPFNPIERSRVLPAYPYGGPPAGLQSQIPKPEGIDLDVTYISRSPMYNRYDVWYTADGRPYLRPGTENDQRWPAPGETVTFTAQIMNKGTVASGDFSFKWFIDGIEVGSGTHPSLAPGQEGTETYQWAWDHMIDGERLSGSHTIGFSVDPGQAIPETYESNNNLEDRTDALSLVLGLTPELYAALETPVDPKWLHSAEDWLQKQIAAMNAAFTRSVYPSAPTGVVERVRLDKIVVSPTSPPTDWSEDGGFFLSQDDRFGNPYYDPETDVSGSLLHELTHQLGIIDLYALDVPLEVPQVLDRNGRPVQMEYWTSFLFPGLMNDPGIDPPIYDEHSSLALNTNKGYRRGDWRV
ncbi:MAG: CARDB domain-containing protein, partial [Anaerolineales bacterium]